MKPGIVGFIIVRNVLLDLPEQLLRITDLIIKIAIKLFRIVIRVNSSEGVLGLILL